MNLIRCELFPNAAHCYWDLRVVVRVGALFSSAEEDMPADRTPARKFVDLRPGIFARRCLGAAGRIGDAALGERENFWRDLSPAAVTAVCLRAQLFAHGSWLLLLAHRKSSNPIPLAVSQRSSHRSRS